MIAPWTETVAAHGLPTGHRPPGDVLAASTWSRLVTECRRRRLCGALADAIARGSWPTTEAQRTDAFDAQRAVTSRDLLLEQHLLGTLARLESVGVQARVLKGPAVAHLVYPDPALRSFRDIDLLVPGDQMDRAVATLMGVGARRRYPEPRPGFDRRFGKGAAMRHTNRVEVDLHRTLAQGVYGELVHRALAATPSATFTLAGREVETLDRTGLALHACVHAVLGSAPPTLEDLRDVAVALHHPRIELDDLWERAEAWQATSVMCHAIGAAWTELRLDDEHPAIARANRHRPDRRDRRRMSPYLGPGRDTTAMTLGQLGAIEGLGPRVAYLRAVVLPDSALRSPTRRWRRGVDSLRTRLRATSRTRRRPTS